jgi:hypothetical protein
MTQSTEASAPFSVVLVMDPASGVPPETMGGAPIAVGSSSVAVGTLADVDGPTRFFLGDRLDGPPADGLELRWEGMLPTSGRLGIVSVEDVVLLESAVGECAQIQVWTNDVSEPSLIWVAIDTRHGHAGRLAGAG